MPPQFADKSARATRRCRAALGLAGSRTRSHTRIAWFDQIPKDRASGLEIVLEAEHGKSNRTRFRAGKADHTDAPASGRGGDGNDGVVKVHGKIVAGRTTI